MSTQDPNLESSAGLVRRCFELERPGQHVAVGFVLAGFAMFCLAAACVGVWL